MQSSPQSLGIGWRAWALLIIIGAGILVLVLGTQEGGGGSEPTTHPTLHPYLGGVVGDCRLTMSPQEHLELSELQLAQLMRQDGCSEDAIGRVTGSMADDKATDTAHLAALAAAAAAEAITMEMDVLADVFTPDGAWDAEAAPLICTRARDWLPQMRAGVTAQETLLLGNPERKPFLLPLLVEAEDYLETITQACAAQGQ